MSESEAEKKKDQVGFLLGIKEKFKKAAAMALIVFISAVSGGAGLFAFQTYTAEDEVLPDPIGCDNGTWDADQDGLDNDYEILRGLDPCDNDSDNDSLQDGLEVYGQLTDPLSNDTDNDTLLDGLDPAPLDNASDIDGDGVLDQDDVDWSKDLHVNLSLDWTWEGSSDADITILLPTGNGSEVAWHNLVDSNGTDELSYDWPDASPILGVRILLRSFDPSEEADITMDMSPSRNYVWAEEFTAGVLQFHITIS